ncbi:MAG: T9SS type A sorting domain-containing protein [Bacteroidetes bacterium]|nr:T9SS type A sorting domain-containing protein [Bacteroidota bacterium]
MKIKLLTILVFFVTLLSMNAQTSFSYSSFLFCNDDPMEVPTITGQQGGIFSSSPPGGLSLDAVTGAIYPIASTLGMYTVTYTVLSNGTNPTETYSVAVGIQSPLVPTFDPIATICQGTTPPVLPTTSNNGITGTWSPSTVSNTATTVYTFTPNLGQCAVNITMVIPVLPAATIQISAPSPAVFCQGTQIAMTLSASGVNGPLIYSIDGGALYTITLNPSGSVSIILPDGLEAGSHNITVTGSDYCGGTAVATLAFDIQTAVPVDSLPDVTVCGSYTLPQINFGNYYTNLNGTGTQLFANDILTSSQVVYIYAPAANGMCSAEHAFHITVVPVQMPVIYGQDNHDYIYVDGNTVVQPLLLSVSLNANYTYQWYESGVVIPNANQSTYLVNTHKESGLHVYQVRATYDFGGCESYSQDFVVHESPVPAPLGNQDQTFSQGQTLADLIVNGQNIQWYDGLGRNVNANPLPLSTVLVDGVTYYASQTINGHESPDRLPVTVHLNVMGNTTFDRASVMILPNPVQDILFVQSNEPVNHIEIYNIMGQKLIDAHTSKVMMQSLPSGVYIVQVSTKAGQQSLRVVKE